MKLPLCLLALVLWPASLVLKAGDVTQLVKARDIRKVVADGQHNAFTALVRWQGSYWLAFRKAAAHNSSDGDLVVLRSKDAEKWEQVHRVNALPDDRDPQFLATDSRLFLYDPALKGDNLTSFVTYTDDGKIWSLPRQVYEDRYIFWKPVARNGRFYATAHLKSREGKERDVHLITSQDGIDWKKVSKIRGGNWESETTIHLPTDDHIVAFLRQKYGSPQSSILEARTPFVTWTERPASFHLSGHAVHTIDGVTYLFSRTREGKTTGTMVYIYENEKLHPYCRIPSGGDCSYPEAVKIGNEMLVSYYSSHEGVGNIYTCRVPLRKD